MPLNNDLIAPTDPTLKRGNPRRHRLTPDEIIRDTIFSEVRNAVLRADGVIAFGAHVMEGLVDLDDHRKHLAQEDITRNLLLAEIESETVRQIKAIQRGLVNPWGF